MAASLLAFSVMGLFACSTVRTGVGEALPYQDDIHERLSGVIAREGYSHRIISDRNESEHLDSIHLRIPLDGMKRQHDGVERVLVGIARVCVLPEFSNLPMRIVVATVDADDGKYLQAVMERELGVRKNLTFNVVTGSGEGIVIAVSHPPRIPRSR